MKLNITIDFPEKDIRECIEGIPPHWYRDSEDSPIRMIAMALKSAYEREKRATDRGKSRI